MEKQMARISASIGMAFGMAALIALPACSQKADETETAETKTAETGAGANTTAAAAPAPTDVATLSGVKFADFKGDAAAGEKVGIACKTCHAYVAGKNMVGPSLWAIQGRTAGTVAGYTYSAANKNSGIVWTNEKLFQYLEAPQRVIPGTKMTYTGIKDPQQRADMIAYLDSLK
jgi:cytochrome c